jgi:CRP-like cAMP-binding protein
MNKLEDYIQDLFGIDENEVSKMLEMFEPVTLNKGDYFLKSGQQSRQLAFIQSGIIREFLFIGDKEITKWIAVNGYFVVDLRGFVGGHPSKSNFQALTNCEILVLDLQNYQKMGALIPCWQELEKLFMAKCFGMLEDRIVHQLSYSAEERYQHFFENNKTLFNQVPLQYLASMLGMAPETLSRFRKKGLTSIS